MERSDILNGGKMIQQSALNDLILRDENDQLDLLSNAFLTISQNTELQGDAAAAFKQQMVDYKNLVDSAKSANLYDITDNTTAYYKFIDYYFDGEVILQNQQDALDEKARDESSRDYHYREWMDSYDSILGIFTGAGHYYSYLYYCGCVSSDQEEYEYWKNIENIFDDIKSSTSGLFANSATTRSAINTALESLQENFVDGNYQVDLNADWRSLLVDAFKNYYYTVDESGNKVYDVELIYQDMSRCEEMSDSEYRAYLDTLMDLGIVIDEDIPRECVEDEVLRALEEKMNSNLTDSSGNVISTPYNELSPEERAIYVLIYESRNPDDAAVMDEFTKDMPTGMGLDVWGNPHSYDEDNYNIRFLVYTSPDPEKSLFLEYADEVDVIWDCGCNPNWGYEEEYGGYVLHIDLNGYVDSNGNNKPGGGILDPSGAYVTLFHEYGHYLDDVLGDGIPNGKGYLSEQNDLTNTIRDEVVEDIRNNLTSYCDYAGISLTQDEIDTIMNSIVGPNNGSSEMAGWSTDMINAYNGLVTAYTSSSSSYKITSWTPGDPWMSYEGITDAYCGITDQTIDWGYGHRDYTPSYWYPDGNLSSSVGKEFFAEAYSHNMTQSPNNQLVNTENVLDDSLDSYRDMIDEAAN